jgi:hypothetical protein
VKLTARETIGCPAKTLFSFTGRPLIARRPVKEKERMANNHLPVSHLIHHQGPTIYLSETLESGAEDD